MIEYIDTHELICLDKGMGIVYSFGVCYERRHKKFVSFKIHPSTNMNMN